MPKDKKIVTESIGHGTILLLGGVVIYIFTASWQWNHRFLALFIYWIISTIITRARLKKMKIYSRIKTMREIVSYK